MGESGPEFCNSCSFRLNRIKNEKYFKSSISGSYPNRFEPERISLLINWPASDTVAPAVAVALASKAGAHS